MTGVQTCALPIYLRFQILFSLEFPLLEEKDQDPHLQFAIHQVLFLEDAGKFGIEKPDDQEVNAKLGEIQTTVGSDKKLEQLLSREGLTQDDVKEMIVRYILGKQFIDQRINFFIFISDNDIEAYYKDHLAEWKGEPLKSVQGRINKTLFEQKRKLKLEEFLAKRRAKAVIRINPSYP